jgi:hypothetical protein
MRFTAISSLVLAAAAAVNGAAVEKRGCIEFIGNGYGCNVPPGVAPNWNYCQWQNPNYPVMGNTFAGSLLLLLFFF